MIWEVVLDKAFETTLLHLPPIDLIDLIDLTDLVGLPTTDSMMSPFPLIRA